MSAGVRALEPYFSNAERIRHASPRPTRHLFTPGTRPRVSTMADAYRYLRILRYALSSLIRIKSPGRIGQCRHVSLILTSLPHSGSPMRSAESREREAFRTQVAGICGRSSRLQQRVSHPGHLFCTKSHDPPSWTEHRTVRLHRLLLRDRPVSARPFPSRSGPRSARAGPRSWSPSAAWRSSLRQTGVGADPFGRPIARRGDPARAIPPLRFRR